jgi:hypothetical protein
LFGCCLEPRAQAIADSFVAQIGKGPQRIISASEVNKLSATEIAVKDKDILRSARAPSGPSLREESLTTHISADARDGYQVIFSSAETDPEFTADLILIAFQRDGKKLPETNGPFRIIAPKDKKHTRWIRQLTSIRVLSYNGQ